MTREKLEEIKKLAEAATPGPWVVTSDAGLVHTNHVTRDVWSIPRTMADIECVAALHNAFPAMAKALEEARSEADITKAFHDVAVKERDYERVRANRIEKERDEARAEIERLRETLKQLHLLTETALSNYWCVGVGREALDEIHAITKGLVK